MQQTEIYISTDIEVDGPIPGPHSMLSIGSAAMTENGEILSGFSANLHRLPNATGHPSNMAWWAKHPEAWAVARKDLQSPEKVMRDYVVWLKQLPGKPIFVGYPAVFDFMFVYLSIRVFFFFFFFFFFFLDPFVLFYLFICVIVVSDTRLK